MLIAFFAGVISTLFFLTPGKVQLKDLLVEKERDKLVDFDQAADRVEKANDLALFYASKAGRYIKDKINQ